MSIPVLVVTNAYPDFDDSYHGVFVRKTVIDMAGRGWRSHVLVPRIYRGSRSFEEYPTHTVRRFYFPSSQKLLIEYDSPPLLRLTVLLTNGLFQAVRIARAQRCRLVHGHWAMPAGLIALAAARLTGLPFVLTVHGSDWRIAETSNGPARRAFNIAAGRADRIMSVSGQITNSLLARGIPQRKVTTRPMGVDLRAFGPGDTQRGLTVASTRNLLPLYRVGDLVRAVAALKKEIGGLEVVIAGEGSQRPELENLARESGPAGTVRFTGRISGGEVAQLLAHSRVYVSTSPVEGSSVSLLEALASGCVPVVADIPPNREWVTHGENGLLFEPGNSGELEACLKRALTDDELLARSAAQGPETVRVKGSWQGQIEILDGIYRELAGDRN
ncbi:MAG: glycosyltransferase [Candidatus Glassbacteria bacterium]